MKKEIKFIPAYDKRHKDPNKDYGIHGVELRMVLIGDHGAVQFVVYTNWQLPHVEKEILAKKEQHIRVFYLPLPADVGYHSKKPMYDGQDSLSDKCEYTGGVCYYDGSGLEAEKVFDILVEKGDAGVWEYLENYYKEEFGELK